MKLVQSNKGIVLLAVLVILVIVSVLAVALSTHSIIDLKITGNIKTATQDFFKSDGANRIEVSEIPSLSVPNIVKKYQTLKDGDETVPFNYHYTITYLYYRQAIVPGYSLGMFNKYRYSVKTDANNQVVLTHEYKLGPKI